MISELGGKGEFCWQLDGVSCHGCGAESPTRLGIGEAFNKGPKLPGDRVWGQRVQILGHFLGPSLCVSKLPLPTPPPLSHRNSEQVIRFL